MSPKHLSSREDLGRARDTLRIRDPDQLTVVVGSVALVAQLHERGIEAPIGCDDVDVLCSQEFFDDLLRTGPHLEDINKFQVRWPKGRLKKRDAADRLIDIYPSQGDILPFTACYAMIDRLYPIDYVSCQPHVVLVSGIQCFKIGNKGWLAIIGRHKDTDTVEKILPLAHGVDLVDDRLRESILRQLEITYRERRLHPNRHYARRDRGV